jgi:tyrosyl-tRNA synthetase
MGKSLGNYIGVAEDPVTQFAKVMSIPDEPMRQYFTLLTDLPMAEVDRLLSPDVNPRDAKEALGRAIVTQYAGPAAAEHAAAEFRRRSSGEDPAEIPEVTVPRDLLDAEGRMAIPRLLVALGLQTSTSNARRDVEGGGFNHGPERTTIIDPKATIVVTDGLVVRLGKRKIARVRLAP